MAKWMALFTSASAAFAQDVMGQLQSTQVRDEMEASRAAFVMLLLSVCENQTVLSALSRPYAKGVSHVPAIAAHTSIQLITPPDTRKALSESLASFVPSIIQGASQIAGRLEMFRTETLASFDPIDKKKETTNNDMEDILDSAMALDSFVVPEIPITNSRAGLYIYLNAAVSEP
jgi:mediator of RNA polymerase II transcription subunit 5